MPVRHLTIGLDHDFDGQASLREISRRERRSVFRIGLLPTRGPVISCCGDLRVLKAIRLRKIGFCEVPHDFDVHVNLMERLH